MPRRLPQRPEHPRERVRERAAPRPDGALTAAVSKRRAIAAGVAVALVLAGVLIAVLGSGGKGKLDVSPAAHVRAPLGQIAAASRYLGVPAADVRRELHAGRSLAEIAAVHGRSREGLVEHLLAAREAGLRSARALTPAQRQRRSALLRRRTAVAVTRHGAPVPVGVASVATAASYLGTTPAALRAELQGGRTLAQVADATPGHSSAGLVAALAAAREEALHAAAAAGTISPEEEAELLASLQKRMTLLVNRASAR